MTAAPATQGLVTPHAWNPPPPTRGVNLSMQVASLTSIKGPLDPTDAVKSALNGPPDRCAIDSESGAINRTQGGARQLFETGSGKSSPATKNWPAPQA